MSGAPVHINAASPGGPRYDPQQTDDERESVNNLLLLCYEHHRIIDADPDMFSADFLRGVKAAHEAHYPRGKEPSEAIVVGLQKSVTGNKIDHGSVVMTDGQRGGQAAHTIINLGMAGLGDSLPKDDQLVFRVYDFFSYFMGQDSGGGTSAVPREQGKWIKYSFRLEVFNNRSVNAGLMDIFVVFAKDGETLHREVPGQDTGEIRLAQHYCPPLRSLNLPSNHWTCEVLRGGVGGNSMPAVADCNEIYLTASTVDGHVYRCPLGDGIGRNQTRG